MAHIFGGVHRKDHPANVLMLCSRCHTAQHNPGRINGEEMAPITTGVLLRLKQELGEFDAETLAEITGYTQAWITELVESVPEQYLRERRKPR